MKLRMFLVLACTLLATAGCVVAPYGGRGYYGGGYYASPQTQAYRGGYYNQQGYGHRVWGG